MSTDTPAIPPSPAHAAAHAPHTDWVVGVDLGGTNMRLALYRDHLQAHARLLGDDAAASAPAPVYTHRETVGEERGALAVATRMAAAIERLVAEAGIADPRIPVGVGVAGMLRGFDGLVANAPNLAWRDEPFGAMLADALGPRFPVGVYNDVNAITYGEYAFGSGIGARDVLAVFIGTGIGGGVVTNGQMVEGTSNCAGEVGHFKIDLSPEAPMCGCGGRGCIEAFAGGGNLQARLRRELARGPASLATELAGGADKVTPGHIDQAAEKDDAYALAIYEQLVPMIAVSLANTVFALNPGRLILGGGLLMRTPLLRRRIIERIPSFLTPAQSEPLEIVETLLGEEAGLLGSALLAAQRLGQ
ncbi:ROK family protein [Haliangium ochraceum]|uniref:ROK family protein n=1 Tax=Haliangium ochraceum (strain DSM 14365 / JCM 11303 / SMP-2) TaxID=502025 RepID=D0LVH7_HALO1|nr:ROK family protein [Haliangium ochraceum]ACY17538.1 ROK family protein [Haliangium ochraceum DSM 14365]